MLYAFRALSSSLHPPQGVFTGPATYQAHPGLREMPNLNLSPWPSLSGSALLMSSLHGFHEWQSLRGLGLILILILQVNYDKTFPRGSEGRSELNWLVLNDTVLNPHPGGLIPGFLSVTQYPQSKASLQHLLGCPERASSFVAFLVGPCLLPGEMRCQMVSNSASLGSHQPFLSTQWLLLLSTCFLPLFFHLPKPRASSSSFLGKSIVLWLLGIQPQSSQVLIWTLWVSWAQGPQSVL